MEQLEERRKQATAAAAAQATAEAGLEEAQEEAQRLRQRLQKLQIDGGPEALQEARSVAEALRRELRAVTAERDASTRAARAAADTAAAAADDAARALRHAEDQAAAAQAEAEEEAAVREALQRRLEATERVAAEAQDSATRAHVAAVSAERRLSQEAGPRPQPLSPTSQSRGASAVQAAAMDFRRADERLSRAFADVERLREMAGADPEAAARDAGGSPGDETRQAMAQLESRVSALEQERRDAAARLEAVRASEHQGRGIDDEVTDTGVKAVDDRLEVPDGSVASEGGVWEGVRGVDALAAAIEEEASAAGGWMQRQGPDARRWLRHVAVAVQRRMLAAGGVARDARTAAAAARARADALAARLRTAGLASDAAELSLEAQDSMGAGLAEGQGGSGEAAARAEAAAAWEEVVRLQAALRDAERRLQLQSEELQRLRGDPHEGTGGGAQGHGLPGTDTAAPLAAGTASSGVQHRGGSAFVSTSVELSGAAVPSWNPGPGGLAVLQSAGSVGDAAAAGRGDQSGLNGSSFVGTTVLFEEDTWQHGAALLHEGHGADSAESRRFRDVEPGAEVQGGMHARAAGGASSSMRRAATDAESPAELVDVADRAAADVSSSSGRGAVDAPPRINLSAVGHGSDSSGSSTQFDTARSRQGNAGATPAAADSIAMHAHAGHGDGHTAGFNEGDLRVAAALGQEAGGLVHGPLDRHGRVHREPLLDEDASRSPHVSRRLLGDDGEGLDAMVSPAAVQRNVSVDRYGPEIDSPMLYGGPHTQSAAGDSLLTPPVVSGGHADLGAGAEESAATSADVTRDAGAADRASVVPGGGAVAADAMGGRGSPESDVSLADLARETNMRLQQLAATNDSSRELEGVLDIGGAREGLATEPSGGQVESAAAHAAERGANGAAGHMMHVSGGGDVAGGTGGVQDDGAAVLRHDVEVRSDRSCHTVLDKCLGFLACFAVGEDRNMWDMGMCVLLIWVPAARALCRALRLHRTTAAALRRTQLAAAEVALAARPRLPRKRLTLPAALPGSQMCGCWRRVRTPRGCRRRSRR